jgi:F1F0 ATPase subunit 2
VEQRSRERALSAPIFDDMIAQAVHLLAFAAIGVAIGALYFGRLWLILRRLPRLSHPMVWLLAGTFTRLALVLTAFLLVSQGHWARLLACLGGILAIWIYLQGKARRSP